MPRPPHHLETGRFTNPWPGAQLHGLLDLLKWVTIDRIRHPRPPDPDPETLPRVNRSPAELEVLYARPAEQLAVTWLGHSTLLIELGGKFILTDPVWSDHVSPVASLGPERWVPPMVPLERLPPLDLILLSHNHYDHCDKPTIKWLAKHQPDVPWVCPLKLSPLLRKFGVNQVTELDWWDETMVAGIKVTGTPAQHFSSRSFSDRNATLWGGYALESGNLRIYFAGDTGYHPEFAEISRRLGPFDLAFIPVGAYEPRWFMQPVHMNPEDAVLALLDIQSAHSGRPIPFVVPIHWGTYKLTDEPMDEPPKRFAKLWRAANLPDGRLWTLGHGELRRE